MAKLSCEEEEREKAVAKGIVQSQREICLVFWTIDQIKFLEVGELEGKFLHKQS